MWQIVIGGGEQMMKGFTRVRKVKEFTFQMNLGSQFWVAFWTGRDPKGTKTLVHIILQQNFILFIYYFLSFSSTFSHLEINVGYF